VSGSGISWVICKSAPCSTPAPHHSKNFYRPDALPAAQPTNQQRQSTEKNWHENSRMKLNKTSFNTFASAAGGICGTGVLLQTMRKCY